MTPMAVMDEFEKEASDDDAWPLCAMNIGEDERRYFGRFSLARRSLSYFRPADMAFLAGWADDDDKNAAQQ